MLYSFYMLSDILSLELYMLAPSRLSTVYDKVPC